ncbi:hypothetical protein M427DRAFT_53248 [Gonapodya prolifera JEL478]|uniref:Doublecortin domain-containing protein n=1 Tax=Gonapodya prolifera (strain JEL478) TaxID=1344416 RepID=A0A139ARD7_GONPJ|nr:hypothetical protein M427DRAFT_53248 [Gonapodya prolifera JEL478]|eukprot:KXS19308.1 hypothetical protein M427DRAFT_53248 [Gonapodya prolifera JEL478]
MPTPSVVDRLTDTSKYTGTHKQRFDDQGKGKGLDGREDRVNFDGNTQSESRSNLKKSQELRKSQELGKSNDSLSKKPVVKPKDDFGVKPKKIVLFEYNNRADAGQETILVKGKFPDFKRLIEHVAKFTPTGKPKIILDAQMRQVQDLEELQDGGHYLVITAYDNSKRDDAKLPQKF